MAESELRVPLSKELKEEMDEFKVNWEEVAARAIFDKAERIPWRRGLAGGTKGT